MKYTKFVVDKTISKVTKNQALRSAVKTIIGSIFAVLTIIFTIVFSRAGIMVGAGAIGIYMFSTMYGTISEMANTSLVSLNINTNSTVASSMVNSMDMLSGVTGLLPIVIVAAVMIPMMLTLMGAIGGRGMFDGGAM